MAIYGVLRGILAALTAGLRQTFASDAARLAYLCQAHGLEAKSRGLHRRIRNVGARIHAPVDEAKLSEEGLGYDIRAVAEFIHRCEDVPVPPALLDRLPMGDYPTEQRKWAERDYIRVTVRSWSARGVVAEDAEGGELTIPLRFKLGETWELDYGYLPGLLWPFAQLNLVRPRLEVGMVLPEQIILEPDYLVNISVVAKVFQSYGTSELNLLIDRFTPQETSAPILLGNLSGMLLDRVIYAGDGAPQYVEVVRDFFRENPLGISTCEALREGATNEQFHHDAQRQLAHLREIFRRDGDAREAGVIDLERVVLEPSFICEQLGLQGRMDLIQEDMRVLMEQKSGRWDSFRAKDGQGRPYESHYVQMLLYMAVLRYGLTDLRLRNEDIASYLLYSRYPKGLLRESPATVLLQEAFEMRNRIVRQEYALARGEGLDMLCELTPERLHQRACGRLWDDFILPKVLQVLKAVQQATPAEQAYAGHAITFVAQEQLLAKVGSPKREGSGHAGVWNSSNAEKREQGNLLDGLEIERLAHGERGESREGIHDITLRIPHQDSTALPNFRLGDPVILYAYAPTDEPDPRRGMVHKGAVLEFAARSITVRLNARQRNRRLFEGERLWAIEHDMLEAGFAAQYRGICSFLEAPKERRELLLRQRPPGRDAQRQPKGDYPGFNGLIRKFVQAQDYFLLIGPPGTGKTSKGLVSILREELTDPTARVLLLAYTNRAVDEICAQLEGLKAQHGDKPFAYMRLGRHLSTAPPYRPFLMQELTAACRNRQEILELFGGIRIYTSTVTSLCGKLELFKLHSFTLAIVDEASQILEPTLLPLLSAKNGSGGCSIARFVLIGDEKQLPAVVGQTGQTSRLSSPALACLSDEPNAAEGTIDFRVSIFERLLRQEPPGSPLVHRFTQQGRMHPEVAAFPSRCFYNGQLEAIPLAHQQEALRYRYEGDDPLASLLARRRVLFFAMRNTQRMPSDKVNPAEGAAIARIAGVVHRLYQEAERPFVPDETLGVIVPYRHQIATVRRELERLGLPELMGITIDTVERYQGSQRDVMVYGFTVQQPYQLEFLFESRIRDRETGATIDRKLNVALTRAREQMVIVGNPDLLSSDPLCERLLEHVRREEGYYEWGEVGGGCEVGKMEFPTFALRITHQRSRI
ncbi:MAG: hypothetical protein CSA07_03540 [Bacteroidia bacterium]|nr:MAG: hypothetical protein CSA07_03540 [Bacteroidia bacterium]